MFLQLRCCYRLLQTSHGPALRSLHHLSQTSSRIVNPLLRNGTNNVGPIRRWNTGKVDPIPPDGSKVKVKFRKEDVRRLFRFAKGEGYVILGGSEL